MTIMLTDRRIDVEQPLRILDHSNILLSAEHSKSGYQ